MIEITCQVPWFWKFSSKSLWLSYTIRVTRVTRFAFRPHARFLDFIFIVLLIGNWQQIGLGSLFNNFHCKVAMVWFDFHLQRSSVLRVSADAWVVERALKRSMPPGVWGCVCVEIGPVFLGQQSDIYRDPQLWTVNHFDRTFFHV